MTDRVRVRVEGADRPASALRALLRRVDQAIVTESQAAIVVLRGSRARPTFTLDLPVSDDETARTATRLGGSILAWEGRDGWSHWQRCLAPITARALRGTIDTTRRWALLEQRDAAAIPDRPTPGWQWHVLADASDRRLPGHSLPDHPLPAHVVQWSTEPRIVAPLLGAAAAIVGCDGPLVLDAWRLGRRVLVPIPGGPIETWAQRDAPELSARLAHTIPPLLAESPAFWTALLAEWRSGRGTLAPAMRASIMRAARDAARQDERGRYGALRREMRRLRDDPSGLARDARLWIARTLFARARGPAVRPRER